MYQLRPGQNIRIDGSKFTCVRKLPGKKGWSLINAETYEPRVMTYDDFLEGYQDERIDYLTDADVDAADGLFNPMITDISVIGEEPLREARRRKAYVVACQVLGRERTTKSMKEVILKTATDRGEKAPHISTVYDWIGLYEYANSDIRALLPRTYKRGPRAKQLPHDVFVIINNTVKARYLQRERVPVKRIHRIIVDQINQLNDERSLDRQLRSPSLSTVGRYIRSMDPYEVRVARYGRKKADNWYRVYKKGIVTDRILQRVEVDHTTLNVIVVCEDSGVVLGRPTLTVAIDHRSRAVLGFYLGFEVPSSMSVAHCLHHAFTQKSYLKATYDDIVNDWPFFGIPASLIFDNGREFLSEAITAICETLNIDIDYMPGRQPHYKGVVERFFRTLQDQLIHRLPGTTLSNPEDRGDYDSEKKARITMKKLLGLIHKWIVDIYHQDIHSGINDTPANAWKTSEEEIGPPPMAKSLATLRPLLGGFDQRAISNSGVLLHSLKYNDPEVLQELLRQPDAPRKWQVRFNPSNLGTIEIFDPKSLTYYPIPAVDREYANRQTLYRHNIHKRIAAINGDKVTDIRALCRAERELQEKIDLATQKAGRGGKLKGTSGLDVPRYNKVFTQHVGSDDSPATQSEAYESREAISPTRETTTATKTRKKKDTEAIVSPIPEHDAYEVSQLLDDSSSEFNKEFTYS